MDINGETLDFAVSNSGVIKADGGRVLITAKAAAGVVDKLINMDGVIQANTIEQRGGEIVLLGDDYNNVNVSGTLLAQGDDVGEFGGDVTVTGYDVRLTDNAEVNVSGDSGGGEGLGHYASYRQSVCYRRH